MAVKLRGALLGAGNIALRSHAPQWTRDRELRDAVEIVAVADLAPANLEAIRDWLPEARVYADAERLLASESLDFCDICTPPFTHRALIERAQRAGLHVLCEKPLAPTVEDAEAIARAVRAAGTVFMPCHQYHYSQQWQATCSLLPRIGPIRFAEYEVLRTAANEGSAHWNPTWRTMPALAGGGILVDHGAHIFYQLREALGDPLRVRADVARNAHLEYGVEDTARVTLDYGDHEARIHLTWAARERAVRFRFVGATGEVVGDDRSVTLRSARTEAHTFDDGMSKNSSHSEWYAPLLHEFLERIRAGRPYDGGLDEALHVTRLIDCCYESARVGRELPFAPAEGARAIAVTAIGREPPFAPAEEVRAIVATATTAAVGSPAVLTAPVPVAETPPPTRRTASRKLLMGIRVAMAAVLLGVGWFLVRKLDWGGFWHAIRTSDARWLALAAALNLVALGFAAKRWLSLLRPLAPLSRWRDAFNALVVGLTVSAVVPARGGEVARMAWLHRRTGLSKIAILSSIGLDQYLNVAGLMLGLALMPWLGGVPHWLANAARVALIAFAAGSFLIFALRPARQVASPGPDDPPPAGVLARIRHGLTAARSLNALGGSLAASLAVWAIELVVMRVALHAVGIALPLSATLALLAAVNLMLAFPVAPANLGSLEIGATLGLRGFGIANERALAFAICYHALQIVPIALLGLLIAGTQGLSMSKWSAR